MACFPQIPLAPFRSMFLAVGMVVGREHSYPARQCSLLGQCASNCGKNGVEHLQLGLGHRVDAVRLHHGRIGGEFLENEGPQGDGLLLGNRVKTFAECAGVALAIIWWNFHRQQNHKGAAFFRRGGD